MKQFSYVLTQDSARQTRHMSDLVREAARFQSRVQLQNGLQAVPLGATRSVPQLDMQCGNRVTVTVEGKDEEAAVAAIQNYFVVNM